jgi:DNA-binding NarL/FixJ family response regulator
LRILLIDDDPHGERLSQQLRGEGCDVVEARDGCAALQQLPVRRVDTVIANTALFPGFTCQEVVQAVRRRTSDRAAVMILTPSGDLRTCRTCPHAREGMLDCVDTPAAAPDIVSRLFWLLRRGTPKPAQPPRSSPLTPREQEVLRLLRSGLANREIAARLFIAEKVVEKHVTHLCQKLDVANRTEAVALSYRQPLFTPSKAAG